MQQPPSVSFAVLRSRKLGLGLAVLAALALVVELAWCWATPQWLVAQAIGLLLWAVAVLSAWRWWQAQPQGSLHYDAGQWTLHTARRTYPGSLRVHIDGQSLLWVELFCELSGERFWLWLDQSSEPHGWIELRRAVYSRPSAPALAVNPPQPHSS